MSTSASGFSCQYVSLAVALRVAYNNYRAGATTPTETLVDAIELPRARVLMVILLKAALCEAVINCFLALRFSGADWRELERLSETLNFTTCSHCWIRCESIARVNAR